jgi:transforming growth factor-beta-induced protein
MRKIFILALVLLLAFSSFTAVFAEEMQKDIIETAVDAGTFTVLASALDTAGLVETLKGDGPFTVFAPTDDAFESLLADLGISAEDLLANPDLKNILLYHVLSGSVEAADVLALDDGTMVETLNGQSLEVTFMGGSVYVDEAKVATTDIMASNGVIHVIDKVIMPVTAVRIETADAKALIDGGSVDYIIDVRGASAYNEAHVPDALNIPGPMASDNFLAGVESNGISEEDEILIYCMVQPAAEAAADALFGAGYTNVTIMLKGISGWQDAGYPVATTLKDIVDTAVSNGSFNTLAAALTKANLIETLKGPGPFTVFAPTDDAFAALLSNLGITADQLLANPELGNILLYHVVPGKVMAADVLALPNGTMVETANGKSLKVTFMDGSVYVDGAKVLATDVMATNGVIHVIDAVILPQAEPAEAQTDNPKTGDMGIIPLGFGALASGAWLLLRKKK